MDLIESKDIQLYKYNNSLLGLSYIYIYIYVFSHITWIVDYGP